MGFLSNIQLIGMNKVTTVASLACQFEKCQRTPRFYSKTHSFCLYTAACAHVKPRKYCAFFNALIKKACWHSSCTSGKWHPVMLCQLKDGLLLSAVLVRRYEVSICTVHSNSFQTRHHHLNTWQLLWMLSSTSCYIQIFHNLCKSEEVAIATLYP